MSVSITAFEAKTRFGELLDRVERGEEVVISRRDKPIARIVPEGRPRLQEVAAAVERLRALRADLSALGVKPLTAAELQEAKEDGRP
jgi:prevent-host-death family protein